MNARHLPAVLRAAERGDWRTRAFSLSTAALIASRELYPYRAFAKIAGRVLGSREYFPTSGLRAEHLKGPLTNALVDRSWPVRVAAALALGECTPHHVIDDLEHLLTAPLRAERIAAAAAIRRCGGSAPRAPVLWDAVSAPARIGDHTESIAFLTELAERHGHVLAAWNEVPGGDRAAGTSAADWAHFLAGEPAPDTYGGLTAEIDRYDVDGETRYLLAKPFSPINQRQNVRLIHTFMVLVEHLRVDSDARILDMGGGSAWVSELLVRFGFQPITLDLSTSLLRLGQRRFTQAGLRGRFVAGDAMRLPIGTGALDAVLIMDALHHVPDVSAVFREVSRTLRDGGVFLLAEPGEGHSEAEKSRSEMTEHGVQEREIHVREVWEYGRAAGFDVIKAVPHFAPAVTMTPAQLEHAISSSADTWQVSLDESATFFAPYVLQSMFDHPVLVFQKGVRAVDSRTPGRLRAELKSTLERNGARVHGRVVARNVGDTPWRHGNGAKGDVFVGLQLLDANRRLINREFHRVALAETVGVNCTATVDVECPLPDATTPFVLKIDLVSEQVCWFEDAGSRTDYVPV